MMTPEDENGFAEISPLIRACENLRVFAQTNPDRQADVESILLAVGGDQQSTDMSQVFDKLVTPDNKQRLIRIMRANWDAGQAGVVPQLIRALGGEEVRCLFGSTPVRIPIIRDGNCGYGAYAVSLMMYLRCYQGEVERVFTLLGLTQESRDILQQLLRVSFQWRPSQYEQIQSILSPSLRALAVQRFQEVGTANPDLSFAVLAFKSKCRHMCWVKYANSNPDTRVDWGLRRVPPDDFIQDDLFQISGMSATIKAFFKGKTKTFSLVPLVEAALDDTLRDWAAEFFAKNLQSPSLRALAVQRFQEVGTEDPELSFAVSAFKSKCRQMCWVKYADSNPDTRVDWSLPRVPPDDFIQDDLFQISDMSAKIKAFFTEKTKTFSLAPFVEAALDDTLRDWAEEFFAKYLECCIEAYGRDGWWATTNMLTILHEKIWNNSSVEMTCDGGAVAPHGNKDIFLFNTGTHWESLILPKFFVPEASIIFRAKPCSPEMEKVNTLLDRLRSHAEALSVIEDDVAAIKVIAIHDIVLKIEQHIGSLHRGGGMSEEERNHMIPAIEQKIAAHLDVLIAHRSTVLPVIFSLLAALTGIGLVIGIVQAVYTDGNACLFWRCKTTSMELYGEVKTALSALPIKAY